MTQVEKRKDAGTAETTAASVPSRLPEPFTESLTTAAPQASPTTSSLLSPKARLRIHFEDVTHPAVGLFATHIPLATILQSAIDNVDAYLFTPPSDDQFSGFRPTPHPTPHWKPQQVRAITLLLRDIDGVAYTTGTDLDESHKEIHISMKFIKDVSDKHTSSSCTQSTSSSSSSSIEAPPPPATTAAATSASPIPVPPSSASTSSPPSRQLNAASFAHEISGVITHEMVHCFQHNAAGTCPGGLIEGIADYVRTKSGLGAQHWKKFPANKDTRGGKWDEGYQKTAWFLEWVEDEIGGRGCIGALNERMRMEKWHDGKLWEKVMNGVTVDECWEAYTHAWEGMKEDDRETS